MDGNASICAREQLKPWDRRGLVALLIVVLLFGVVVEWRSAFLHRRMTDLSIFLRAAWAVRAGEDFYSIEDENHWHFHYPPLFVILMTPLADAPRDTDRTGLLPFGASVIVWYFISLAFIVLGVHWLAGALEATTALAPSPRFSRRWWMLRALPVVVCLPILGASLVRGQVDPLLLMLLCGMAAAMLRRQSFQAGLWLAGAICLKIIPAFLLIYPLWRGDRRWLAGCAAGLLIGLLFIPIAALGPTVMTTRYRKLADVLILPALGTGDDRSRAKELTDTTSTDSQSFLAIMHNLTHLEQATRPAQASAAVRKIHWIIGGILTVLTLIAAGRRSTPDDAAQVLILGALFLLMILISPVCHLHYFCLAIPILMGLIASASTSECADAVMPLLGKGLIAMFIVYAVANALPRIPGLGVLRDVGLATYAALMLWGTACVIAWRRNRPAKAVESVTSRRAA